MKNSKFLFVVFFLALILSVSANAKSNIEELMKLQKLCSSKFLSQQECKHQKEKLLSKEMTSVWFCN